MDNNYRTNTNRRTENTDRRYQSEYDRRREKTSDRMQSYETDRISRNSYDRTQYPSENRRPSTERRDAYSAPSGIRPQPRNNSSTRVQIRTDYPKSDYESTARVPVDRRQQMQQRNQPQRSPYNQRRNQGRNPNYGKQNPGKLYADELAEGKSHFLVFFFPLVILYFELLLRLFSGERLFYNFHFILLFSAAYGFLIYLICSLYKSRKTVRFVTILTLIIIPVIFLIEFFCKQFFTYYMSISAIFNSTGMLLRSYFVVTVLLILRHFYVVLLYFVPVAIYFFSFKGKLSRKSSPAITKGVPVAGTITLFLLALLLVYIIPGGVITNREFYTSEFNITESSEKFGLMTGIRLDAKYLIFGTPKASDGGAKPINPIDPTPQSSTVTPDPNPDPDKSGTESSEVTPVEYGYNVMDIDFATLIANEKNNNVKEMHEYFASLTPTKKNQYTGLFKGKNVIVLTGEAFSAWAIDKDLTPTLYRMQTKGIYFTNFYQPSWGYSTSDGEYSHLLGLIPKSGKESMYQARNNNLYFTIGNQTTRLGYFTRAYHNNTYTYYKRNETHENLGYEKFIAIGNGLEGLDKVWPKSDKQMIEHTIDEYINKEPFSIYYMTVSGHANYNWEGNMMSYRNRAAVEHLNLSEPVAAYKACNLELEYAMQYLVERLEEAGIADDTVIVMTGDHYPYGLESDGKNDGDKYKYLNELAGETLETNVGIHKNACIIWSKCLEDIDPIQVDDPCYSIDILPTVSNLFGFEYDSRLLAGRDALSESEPFVVFRNYSWISSKGYFNHKTETFYPNEGVTVPDDYVKTMSQLAKNKINYSRYILEEDYYSKIFGKKK